MAVDMLFQLLLSMVGGLDNGPEGADKDRVWEARNAVGIAGSLGRQKRRDVQQSQVFGRETGNSKSQVWSAARVGVTIGRAIRGQTGWRETDAG